MRSPIPFAAIFLGLIAATGFTVVACSDAGGSSTPASGGGGGGTGGNAEGGIFTGGSGGTGTATGGSGGTSVLPGSEGGLPEGCATDSYAGEIVPLDMHIMLDRSGSMSVVDVDGGTSRWTQVTNAFAEFMSLPGTTGLGIGLAFFPTKPSIPAPTQCQNPSDCLPYSDMCMMGTCFANQFEDDSCLTVDYRTPVVPMGQLPGVGDSINDAMSKSKTSGMTPMAPALWGALEYASDWAKAWPHHVTLVVLATDGYPTHCIPGEIEDVAAIAEGGFQHFGIRTFVIGIGEKLLNLNLIAEKGGTEAAIMVEGGNAETEFLDALNQIRGSVGCIYKVPVPEEGIPDHNLLNVAFTPEGGAQEIYPRVNSEEDCVGEKGWYYDDPASPNQIILCPASCDQIQQVKGVVDIVLGCQAIVK